MFVADTLNSEVTSTCFDGHRRGHARRGVWNGSMVVVVVMNAVRMC